MVGRPVAELDQPRAIVTANAIATMDAGSFLRPESDSRRLVTALAAVVVVALLWALLPRWAAAGLSVALATGWWLYVQDQVGDGRVLGAVGPIGAVAVMGTTVGLARLVGALQHRRRVSRLFSRYVPGSVATQLMEGGRAEELAAGREHDITALFIDLRGFTPLSRQLEPPQIRRLLDHFYEYVCARVLDHDGTIMQFVGDEVFAVFGAPLDRPDHAAAAIAVALRLQNEVDQLDATLADDDLPPVRFGVGVNSGQAVAAHVGTAARSQYSVLGDTVNTAARLVSIAAADQVIASAATVDSTENPDLRPVGQVDLKGIDVPVTIYQYGPGEPRGTITTAATLSP